jgi:hypothetical protein
MGLVSKDIESQAIARTAEGHTKIDADGTIINLVRHIEYVF